MRKHWLIVHKGFLKCESCFEVISSKKKLAEHMQNSHQLRICDQCGFKTTRGSYVMKLHTARHKLNMESKQSFKPPSGINCPECAGIFPNKGRLNAHYNKVHRNKTPCLECGKEVKNMPVHMETKHRASKKYQCDKCPKTFVSSILLTTHDQADHQGVRYYCRYSDCPTKGQEYRDKSNRGAHERKRHGGNLGQGRWISR